MLKLGSKIHDLGKALMTPISVIAAAGIFLGLASALQNPNVMGDTFTQMKSLQLVIGFIRQVSSALFANLPLFFAVATAMGLANAEKATAAFSAVIGFVAMHVGINYSLLAQNITPATTSVEHLTAQGMGTSEALIYASEFTNTLGIFTYNMSVLGGVLVGLITMLLHNRFYTIVLPTAVAFFGGRRFVPIITVVVLPIVGVLVSLVWPTIALGIQWVGELIGRTGEAGTFIYATSERLLIPTGLHHIINETVRFTPLGGVTTVDNQSIVGALNIFNAALAHPGTVNDEVTRQATRFLAQGKIPVMMFGLPAAALAMYHCAKPEHKGRVKALMLAGALASFTTGITEPLEFCFIFVSPVLYVMHAVLTGLSFVLMQMLNVMIGNVQGGAIDWVIFGILGGSKTHWWYPLMLGIIYAPLYYFSFRWIITRMQVKTPGREDDAESEELRGSAASPSSATALSSSTASDKTSNIIKGLGGEGNIDSVDCCFTRLRVKVKDMNQVVDKTLMTTGAMGVKRVTENDVHVIYGPQVEKIAHDVKNELAS
ncbi:PTS maltose transporter subunit IICB [Rouxiella sp. S1S-2]|uniref:PTS transporter subunit EIIC n=1 Tax=Rouxiella sp. S1S-2 TaxID=2653856 RepID=UPI001264105A|nr:PTS transporter subunit EIIC [Rouxiella sp. S1S-2]KAB7895454.1 PTS maltose transporter subunit IICB [Rouxiella sp. S1S-2]